MTPRQILNTCQTVEALCRLANKLGYADKIQYLGQYAPDACLGDLVNFFEDNPGAIEAVIEWAADNHGKDEDEEDEDSDDEEDEDSDDEES